MINEEEVKAVSQFTETDKVVRFDLDNPSEIV